MIPILSLTRRKASMKRILTGMFAVIIALAFSNTTFSQVTPATPATPPEKSASAVSEPATPEAKGEVKAEKKGKRAASSSSKADHSNKGGELRGLDRADQSAGEHGQQGRTRARDKQGG